MLFARVMTTKYDWFDASVGQTPAPVVGAVKVFTAFAEKLEGSVSVRGHCRARRCCPR